MLDGDSQSVVLKEPVGRWVLIDWEIANEGTIEIEVWAFELKVETDTGFVVAPDSRETLIDRQMRTQTTLAPSQTLRGVLAYDVPLGQDLADATYQPLGGARFVIVSLSDTTD